MRQPPAPPASLPPTLAEQKADFTAEGAPPPGKVATADPARPPAPGKRAAAKRRRPHAPVKP